MSYCRWSSADYQCDIYLYESCYGGFDICIAKYKRVFDTSQLPVIPEIGTVSNDDWANRYLERDKQLRVLFDATAAEEITLPHAGETLKAETAADCIVILKQLKELGYRLPDYTISNLTEECSDEH